MTTYTIDYSDCVAHISESIDVLDRLCDQQPQKREELRRVIADLRRQVASLAPKGARLSASVPDRQTPRIPVSYSSRVSTGR